MTSMNILITGANSYIGTSFEKFIKQFNAEHSEIEPYIVHTLDMQSINWREYDFSKYDSVIHLAGIVHIKETESNKELYYKINRDLAFDTAQKAKESNVKQFIYFSTMSVYGLLTGIINANTPVNPQNAYGKSKLEAEGLIKSLSDNHFKVAIVRPPMVYGKDCKGNYQTLCKIAKYSPIFPKFVNKRSMVSIERLCDYLFELIKGNKDGVFFPQDKEYSCTSTIVKKLANSYGRKIYFTKLFNPIIRFFFKSNSKIGKTIQKAFGNLIYDKKLV